MSVYLPSDYTDMAPRSDLSDESVLKKWMAIEMGRINDGVITQRRRLSVLLQEKNPSAVTRKGKEFAFDRTTLHELEQRLPEKLRNRLSLPVIFYFDSQVADSCFLTDEAALEAFQILGELSDQRTMTGGKLWVGRAIVYAMMRKYPTMIQIMMR
jgi:uncharacterized protein (UPF0216 family)